MFQRSDRQRKFRSRTNGRKNFSHRNNGIQNRTNAFSNGQSRNNFRPTQSPEKSFEKYSLLAKEALSSGDQTLSENYLQHADHFIRIIEDRNKEVILLGDMNKLVGNGQYGVAGNNARLHMVEI